MFFFFLMIRRPPRSTLDRSSAASDVYKRQEYYVALVQPGRILFEMEGIEEKAATKALNMAAQKLPVSYTHLRAHETVLDLVCRLLLEKKKQK